MKTLRVNLTTTELRRLKIQAVEKGQSLSALVTGLLKAHLAFAKPTIPIPPEPFEP